MNRKNQAGFTLVELLVTTAIIGILIGIVVGVAGLASKKSDEGKARAEMQQIGNALEEYRIKYGRYPQNLSTLKNNNTEIDVQLKSFKDKDPWGRDYEYTRNSDYSYRLFSRGAKGTDASDDIDSSRDSY